MAQGVEKTHFTLDVLGRYTCNTDLEAIETMNRPDARPFDVIVIGGGSFGPIATSVDHECPWIELFE